MSIRRGAWRARGTSLTVGALVAVAAFGVAGVGMSGPAAAAPPPTGADVVATGLEPDQEIAADPPDDLSEALDLPPTDSPSDPSPSPDPSPSTDPSPGMSVDPPAGAEELLTASGAASGFTVVGITWDAGTGPDGMTAAIRSRTGADWSSWEPMAVDVDGADDGGAGQVRDGTDPVAVGAVDEVQVAVHGVDGAFPANPQLVVIDPDAHPGGQTEISEVSADGSAEVHDGVWHSTREDATAVGGDAQSIAMLPAAATRRPTIFSRADWGADESLMTWTPQVGRVTGAIIHHTVNANNYTMAQVPSIIRGIYAYHAVSRGWGDIGYNVLVDRFGRAWQGRAGGVDRAIVAAHATGWNSEWFGISVIGDFSQAQPPQAAVDTVSAVVAWKLSLHGVRANASTIRGHRDVGQTACPGVYLYARLGEIRASAAARQGDWSERTLIHDLTGDGRSDVVANDGASISVWASTVAGWDPWRQVGKGWKGPRTIAPGDFTGDGVPDLMLRNGETLRLYPGLSSGGWEAPREVAITGLAAMDLVVGGHDWNSDGATDLLARNGADGSLWLYAGDGAGGVSLPRQIGSGWGSLSLIQMAGNLSDGRPALVARDNEGQLVMYVGDGTGGLSTRTVVGPGWLGMDALVGVGDMNDDGNFDLVARSTTGLLYLYAGNGSGGFSGRTQVGNGWGGFTAILSAGREGIGQDLFAIDSNGMLRRYVYHPTTTLGRQMLTTMDPTGVVEVIYPGDWNGDGRADLMTRRSNGDLYLHVGDGAGGFAGTGVRVGSGWNVFAQVVGAGDWLGTGVPTLVGLDRGNGRIWLYPGDGNGRFGSRVLLASDIGDVDAIVAAGRWSGGLVPDLLTRVAADGTLQLRRGNGGGLLGSPTQAGRGWQGMSVVGGGDVDGDGRPDLVAVRGTELRLYPGNGSGGFLAPRILRTVSAGTTIS